MKTNTFILISILVSILFTGCKKNEDVIGNKILTFYIELTNEDGTPIITSDKEAEEFPSLQTIAVNPSDLMNNFDIVSKPLKGENNRYYLKCSNYNSINDSYEFIIKSKTGFNGEYLFEITWDSTTLKNVIINGKESNISEVTFDDVKYYSVSLIIK